MAYNVQCRYGKKCRSAYCDHKRTHSRTVECDKPCGFGGTDNAKCYESNHLAKTLVLDLTGLSPMTRDKLIECMQGLLYRDCVDIAMDARIMGVNGVTGKSGVSGSGNEMTGWSKACGEVEQSIRQQVKEWA